MNKGGVLDMAISVIMGGAFGKIVSSLVSDVLMPSIGLLTGGVDCSSLFLNLTGAPQPFLAAITAAGELLFTKCFHFKSYLTSSSLHLYSFCW